jgi:hypothetical protein
VLGPLDTAPVLVAKTASRHILSVMNDIAFHVEVAIAGPAGLPPPTSQGSTTASAADSTNTTAATSHH